MFQGTSAKKLANQLADHLDDVVLINITVDQARDWLDPNVADDSLNERLEAAVDAAQGEVFSGTYDETFVLIRIGGQAK